MICFFNRKELLVTQDTAVLSRAENVLKERGVEYVSRLEDTQGGNSLGSGRMRGIPVATRQWIYRIYVKKDAYEYASYLIRNA